MYKTNCHAHSVKVITAVLALVSAFGTPLAHAWNLICLVSINYTGSCDEGAELLAEQYAVDSKVLQGISDYNAALSEIQLIKSEDVKAGRGSESERGHIKSARQRLGAAANAVRSAVDDGHKLLTRAAGTDCHLVAADRAVALDSLKQAGRFVEVTSRLSKKIDAGVLPAVAAFHEGALLTQKMTSNGMKLSKAHLGKAHHTGENEELKIGGAK